MKKITVLLAIVFLASCLNAQVQLGKNVQIGGAVGGVTSLNTLTGDLSVTGDSSITVTPSGSSIALHATGTGGSGVQYNPTTTAYFVTSFSGLYDDSDANSANLGVPSSVSCDGASPTTTCTVVFPVAHGLSVGGAVDMSNLSTWPAGPAGVQQSAQYGSFQVATVPIGTSLTFTTPARTPSLTYSCAPCTGNTYDASLWGIWQFARQPYIYGHGTVYGIETTTQNAAASLATWIAGITGTPKFLIDQTGQNDFFGGRTVAQVEADHQTLWAAAHTAGMTVVQTTMVPASYGLTGVDIKPGQFNLWLWQQASGKTAAMLSSGQYIDRYADTATASLMILNAAKLPNPAANQIFAQTVNNAFGVQSGLPIAPPTTFSYSNSGVGSDVPSTYLGNPLNNFSQTWENYKTVNMDAGGFNGNDWYASSFHRNSINRYWNTFMTAGQDWCSDSIGLDANTNDQFLRCFHLVGAGNTGNYAYEGFVGAAVSNIRKYPDGTVSLPSVATAPSTSPICPNGANGALTTTGCAGGGSSDYASLMPSLTATGCTISGKTCSTTAAVSAITLSGIPGTYTHLKLLCRFITTATDTNMHLTFNGDTGAHYDYEQVVFNNGISISGSHPTATTFISIGDTVLAGSSYGGTTEVTIDNYANINFWKTVLSTGTFFNAAGGGFYIFNTNGGWESTAAITSLTITASGTDQWAANSTCTLDGYQ